MFEPAQYAAPSRIIIDCGANTVTSQPMAMKPPSVSPEAENGTSLSNGTGIPQSAVKYQEMV